MAKILSSNAGDGGFTPGLEAKIPYALWPENQDIKQQKQYCNKFNKDFKNGAHLKKKKKLPGAARNRFFPWSSVSALSLSVCLSVPHCFYRATECPLSARLSVPKVSVS